MVLKKISPLITFTFVISLLMCDLPTDNDNFNDDNLEGTWKVVKIIDYTESVFMGQRDNSTDTTTDHEEILTFKDTTVTFYSYWQDECYDAVLYNYSISGNKLRGRFFDGAELDTGDNEDNRLWYTEIFKDSDQLKLIWTEVDFDGPDNICVYVSTWVLKRYKDNFPPISWPDKECVYKY